MALGVLSSKNVSTRGPLPKPVIAPVSVGTETFGFPRKGEGSGVKNLNYLTFPDTLVEDLVAFWEVVPFKNIAVFFNPYLAEALPVSRRPAGEARLQEQGIELTLAPVGRTVGEALDSLPEDVDAAYLSPVAHLMPGELDKLVAGLIERRLPSFSMFGYTEVEHGVLAGLCTQELFPRIARRAALNVQRILLGDEAGSLPVIFQPEKKLVVNMATARAIGIYPTWLALAEAELLFEEDTEAARSVSLRTAVNEALLRNLDLAAERLAVAAGAENVREARGDLLPQVGLDALGLQIDRDRAEAAFSQQRERTLSGSIGVSQLVYSEPARANVSIQGSLQAGREAALERARLDTTLTAARAYFNVLRAKTLVSIQRENLRSTRSNLDLARLRQEVGFSGPGEVYRWESEVALGRKDLIKAEEQRTPAEIELNRILHRPLNEAFVTEEVDLLNPTFLFNDPRMFSYIYNPISYEVFIDFNVARRLEAAPELRQVDAAIAAQERSLLAARRALFTPFVGASAELGRNLYEGGAGGDGIPAGVFPFDLSEPDETDWILGLNVSFPLFSGGKKSAVIRRAREELSVLRIQRQSMAERIEQRIRSALQITSRSYEAIRQSQQAAGAAGKNLELVTDAYSRGALSIIDLIDAQNAALVSDLAAADAVYDFFIDYVGTARAMNDFDLMLSGADRDAFFESLDRYYGEAGVKIRRVPVEMYLEPLK